MHPFTVTVITAALFPYYAYGFPIKSDDNDRISKRHAVIRCFLTAVSQCTAEVHS